MKEDQQCNQLQVRLRNVMCVISCLSWNFRLSKTLCKLHVSLVPSTCSKNKKFRSMKWIKFLIFQELSKLSMLRRKCNLNPVPRSSVCGHVVGEEPATVFNSVSCTFSCACTEAGKTNMATNLRNFQFVSRNIPNLAFIRRGFQSVKNGHRKYSSRAVSRSNSGVMRALTWSRNLRYSQQTPCFPVGGKLSSQINATSAILFVNRPLVQGRILNWV